jgi:hypothetical protein
VTEEICIDWNLEASEIESSFTPESETTQLVAMTLDEEVREILIPLKHPVGAASIQVIGLGTTYECVIHYTQQNKPIFDETNIEHAAICMLGIFAIISFLCWKYWLPRHLSWITVSLLTITTWILAEWSLFLE